MTGAAFYAALTAASHCAPGCSQKEAVWQSGKLTLYRYRPIARAAAGGVPLLIVYALVNRPYMMDLQEDRSLIRGLLASGLDVYLIDWGYPDGADRFTTLADYIDRRARDIPTHPLIQWTRAPAPSARSMRSDGFPDYTESQNPG